MLITECADTLYSKLNLKFTNIGYNYISVTGSNNLCATRHYNFSYEEMIKIIKSSLDYFTDKGKNGIIPLADLEGNIYFTIKSNCGELRLLFFYEGVDEIYSGVSDEDFKKIMRDLVEYFDAI